MISWVFKFLFSNVIQRQLILTLVLIEIWLLIGDCCKVNVYENERYQILNTSPSNKRNS